MTQKKGNKRITLKISNKLGWSNSTAGGAFVLHTANLGLFPGIQYGSLSLTGVVLSTAVVPQNKTKSPENCLPFEYQV